MLLTFSFLQGMSPDNSPKSVEHVRIQEVRAQLGALPILLLRDKAGSVFATGQIGNNVCRIQLHQVPCAIQLRGLSTYFIKNRGCKKVVVSANVSGKQKRYLTGALRLAEYSILFSNDSALVAIYPSPEKHHSKI